MDKFVDSFSRGLKKTKIHPTKAKKSGTLQGTQHQMFLDLGQKLFGKSKECKNCGMYFVIGDVDDERRHNQICAKLKSDQMAIIIEIRNKQSSFPESITKVLKFVENELGSAPDYLTEGNQTVYLCITNKEGPKSVLGCLVAEEVQPDDLYMLSSTVTATDISLQLKPSCGSTSRCDTDSKKVNISDITGIHHPEIDSASSCSEASPCCDPSPLARKRVRGTEDEDRPLKGTLGVRQIWVHKDHRKGGIARALVDVAREHFAYGTVVMRPHTAFSQPTSDGLNFALAYSQQETVWAYA